MSEAEKGNFPDIYSIEFTKPRLNELRRLSDKVRFSEMLGLAWERNICIPRLEHLTDNPMSLNSALHLSGGYTSFGIIKIDADVELRKQIANYRNAHPQLQNLGHKILIPDVVVIFAHRARPQDPILGALDCKVNLSMAETAQIGTMNLRDMMREFPMVLGKINAELDKRQMNNTEPKIQLRRAKSIPAEIPTGWFMTPKIQENISAQIAKGNRLPDTSVYFVDLQPHEIHALLKGLPGESYWAEAGKLHFFGVERTAFDTALLRARAAAVMAGNIHVDTPEKLKSYLDTIIGK